MDEATERELVTLSRGLELLAMRSLAHAEDARDAVQETLARAVAAIRRAAIPPGVPLGAFVAGIARHVIADVQRARSRDARLSGLGAGERASEATSLERLVRAEERAAVRRALARLRPADQDLLSRCYVDGARLTEIAAERGEPVERIRKRKSRALGRLREILARDPGVSGHDPPAIPTNET